MDDNIKPSVMRGVAALMDALDIIGQEGKCDKSMAEIICDHEIDLRNLMKWTVEALSEEI